jgi:pimeloyl-ACP methyl ester carboxylesterase
MGLFDLVGARSAHDQIYGGGMPHADITHEVLAGAVGFEAMRKMMFFLLNGYRVVAHDRRGHGRSTQTSGGHGMDHYAVGHSTGGGEVVRYLAGFKGQIAGHRPEFTATWPPGHFVVSAGQA